MKIKFNGITALNCVDISDDENDDTIEESETIWQAGDIETVEEIDKYYLKDNLHYDFQFGNGTMAFCINSKLFTIIEN